MSRDLYINSDETVSLVQYIGAKSLGDDRRMIQLSEGTRYIQLTFKEWEAIVHAFLESPQGDKE